jgi:hypothetical protein
MRYYYPHTHTHTHTHTHARARSVCVYTHTSELVKSEMRKMILNNNWLPVALITGVKQGGVWCIDALQEPSTMKWQQGFEAKAMLCFHKEPSSSRIRPFSFSPFPIHCLVGLAGRKEEKALINESSRGSGSLCLTLFEPLQYTIVRVYTAVQSRFYPTTLLSSWLDLTGIKGASIGLRTIASSPWLSPYTSRWGSPFHPADSYPCQIKSTCVCIITPPTTDRCQPTR